MTEIGGAMRDRTADPLRARQVLSQLSYSPSSGHSSVGLNQALIIKAFKLLLTRGNSLVGLGGLEPPTSPLSGVRSNHLSYRPNLMCSYNAFALCPPTKL
jgi:hypothetical protein